MSSLARAGARWPRDALRAARRYGLEPGVHFVESSTALKDVQLATVPGRRSGTMICPPSRRRARCCWSPTNSSMRLPVRQLVKTPDGWRERMVGLEGDRFVRIAGSSRWMPPCPRRGARRRTGTILETCPGAAAIVYEVAGRLVEQGGAALFIDYGHDRIRDGSTLQAVRAHRKVDPFAAPGEADLTAHVDFATLADRPARAGARVAGHRAAGPLAARTGHRGTRRGAGPQVAPQHAGAVRTAKERLIGEGQMGALFKVMGLAAPGWPDGAGFHG
jgi:NADH dehydrogenase [ubiquinone] 1 alpha subcomplex assembly factor 7